MNKILELTRLGFNSLINLNQIPRFVQSKLSGSIVYYSCPYYTEQQLINSRDIDWKQTPEKISFELSDDVPKPIIDSFLDGLYPGEDTSNKTRFIEYCPPDMFVNKWDSIILLQSTVDGRKGPILYLTEQGKIIGPLINSTPGRNKRSMIDRVARMIKHTSASDLLRIIYGNIDTSEFKRINTAICLASRNSMNYGHWVLEHLPKVIRASHTLEDSPQVIVKEPTKWQIESLNLIGVSNNDIRCIASDPILVKEFIQTDVKSVYSRDFSLCKENYLSIANIMKSRINLKQTSSSRIFVSRQSVGHRCVKNMNEVNSVLDQFDFEIIYPEKMSIKDQIKTFHHANVIMGATGSGLANMIFMENGSIFSLVDSSWISGLFYGLAQSLNHKFYSVLSRSRRIPHNIPHPYTGKPANNIIVDTDSLRKQLNNHLSR